MLLVYHSLFGTRVIQLSTYHYHLYSFQLIIIQTVLHIACVCYLYILHNTSMLYVRCFFQGHVTLQMHGVYEV